MSIRIRTGYSFRKAVGSIDHVLDRVKECGWETAAITDTASTFGFVRWGKACDKRGIKPVFGVELAVSPSIHAKKPASDHWTFITKDDIGPLNRLVAMASEQFRYQPLLSIEQALNAEGVFKIVGHRSLINDLPKWKGDLYLALGPAVTKGYFNAAIKKGLKPIAASDNRYPLAGDRALYEVICGREASTQSYPQWIMNDDEWWEEMKWVGGDVAEAAMAHRASILEASTATLRKGQLLHPTTKKTLRQLCIAGAKKLGCDLKHPVYKARLDKELSLIAEKKFEDYFFIIADICQWARQRMIVGPARGSSCGSLVCYLLEITTVDPIPHGLIFERFIDTTRSDLPDIDIDFSDQKRQMVFDYVAQKYGKEHVARLGTVAMYQPRSALKEAAAALDIPPWKLTPVMDAIVERSSGDARALQATEDTLKETAGGRALLAEFPEIEMAMKMEGHPRHHSQHAAGIVLTETPVSDFVAVDQRTGATHCDKKDAEELNLLKIDALGLTQLSIFEDALAMAGLPMNHLFSIPTDDEAAFQVLNDKKYSGIFQFNGLALQSITDMIDVKCLNDIVAITALARPGPLNTGGTNRWIKVKTGKEPATYPHPAFKADLEDTLGVVAYQEQVMNIGRNVGDLSWDDVTALRKAMSKSLGKEFFDKYGTKWKEGARKKGIKEETLDKVWDDLCAYGSWAFNKSHAVAYGLVSYYCCWLKAHYPLEFAAASLTHTDSPETQIKLLREMAVEGVEYIPADIELSGKSWTVGNRDGKKILVGPLDNVVGLGPKMMSEIMSCRARNEPLSSRAQKLLANPKTKIDSLFPIGERFKKLMPDPRERNIFSQPNPIINVQTTGEDYEVLVFCTTEQIKPRDENEQMTIAKRGYAVKGPTASLNLRLSDDTDVIFAKVNRYDFPTLGAPIVNRGRPGKALYAIKGRVPKDFRMINVKAVRYIGDLEKDEEENEHS